MAPGSVPFARRENDLTSTADRDLRRSVLTVQFDDSKAVHDSLYNKVRTGRQVGHDETVCSRNLQRPWLQADPA